MTDVTPTRNVMTDVTPARSSPRASKVAANFYLQNPEEYRPFNKFLDLDRPSSRQRAKPHRTKNSHISPLARKTLSEALSFVVGEVEYTHPLLNS